MIGTIMIDSDLNRIRDILNNMTPKEFDNMLEDCGINETKPSHESDYVLCMLGELTIREETEC
ncbi:hypothetical protein [Kineothrix sedimenti]|uniref:Uncharacterized protein n=1 Tax=Kineothrix sedimenti TaxID=3123317 RepID=A0ABZ3F1B4_9FIRM